MSAPLVRTEPAQRFVPRRWLENGHAMTVFVWARKREFSSLPAPTDRLFRVDSESQVFAQCY